MKLGTIAFYALILLATLPAITQGTPLSERYCASDGKFEISLQASSYRTLTNPYLGYADKPDAFVEEPWDAGWGSTKLPDLKICAMIAGVGWSCSPDNACKNSLFCDTELQIGLPNTVFYIADQDITQHDQMQPVMIPLTRDKGGNIQFTAQWDGDDIRPIHRQALARGEISVTLRAKHGWVRCAEAGWFQYLQNYQQPVIEGLRLKEFLNDISCLNALTVNQRITEMSAMIDDFGFQIAIEPSQVDHRYVRNLVAVSKFFSSAYDMQKLLMNDYTKSSKLAQLSPGDWPVLIRSIREDAKTGGGFARELAQCIVRYSE